MITSGLTTINESALKGYTKEQVKELLQGKIEHDFEFIWQQICAINGCETKQNILSDVDFNKDSKQRKKS